MGELSGGSSLKTSTTAKRFGLRSVLLRISKDNRARTITASVLCISLAAVVGAAYAVESSGTSTRKGATDNASVSDKTNSATKEESSSVKQSNNLNNVGNTNDESNSSNNTNKSTVEITVNGKRVSVPANGSYHQSSDDGDTQTNINVENNHSSTTEGDNSSNSSSSSIKIDVRN